MECDMDKSIKIIVSSHELLRIKFEFQDMTRWKQGDVKIFYFAGILVCKEIGECI